VVSGRGTGGAEFVAVTEGTEPRVGVGLLTLNEVAVEAIVAIEDVEFERVGLPGRIIGIGDGIGATIFVFDIGKTLVKAGDVAIVGVGTGVVLAEETAVEMWGCCAVGVGPVYI
jgi:hypothetical protein